MEDNKSLKNKVNQNKENLDLLLSKFFLKRNNND